jgi:hypothetical protein
MPRSVFADLHVANSYRTKFTPRVARPYRPKVIAWAGPAAFYQSRFVFAPLLRLTLTLDFASVISGIRLVLNIQTLFRNSTLSSQQTIIALWLSVLKVIVFE